MGMGFLWNGASTVDVSEDKSSWMNFVVYKDVLPTQFAVILCFKLQMENEPKHTKRYPAGFEYEEMHYSGMRPESQPDQAALLLQANKAKDRPCSCSQSLANI